MTSTYNTEKLKEQKEDDLTSHRFNLVRFGWI